MDVFGECDRRHKLVIRKLAEENIGKKVVLFIKKKIKEYRPFTREVTILKVSSNGISCKGLSGMEWFYPISDQEWDILNIESIQDDKN